jgi:polysaccharide pyruvyl transferase WcaK-like protein
MAAILNIALVFHSSSNDNLGVGALSVSEVAILRQISRDRNIPIAIRVLDSISPRDSYLFGEDISVHPVRPLKRPWGFFSAIRASDLVIDIGGGDSFSDIYGPRRIAQMFFMKYLVHISGRSLVLAPQTFGPFTSRISKFLAVRSIEFSALVSTRDSISTNSLHDMGVSLPIVEACDVALRLPFDLPSPRARGGPVRVGINVSGLLMNGGYTRSNMFGLQLDYARLIRGVLEHFSNHVEDCEIHLIPHVLSWAKGSLEDDLAVCEALALEFPKVVMAPAFSSPSSAKSYIAGMDFFIGARMHACIAAFSSGVPVVPLAYSRKFSGLFDSLGYGETVDCTVLDEGEALRRIFESFRIRAELLQRQRIALENGILRLRNYEVALGDLMESIFKKL